MINLFKYSMIFLVLKIVGPINVNALPIKSIHKIPSGKIHLEGLLIQPNKTTTAQGLVIWLGGSGSFESVANYERDSLTTHRFYLEGHVLRQNFAFLILNKRGMGNSGGHWRRNDFHGRARDVKAAIHYCKQLPDLNIKKIGLAGLSQGGWIAQLTAANNPDIGFVISFAGPTVDVWEQNKQNYVREMQCRGLNEATIQKKLNRRIKKLKFASRLGKILPVGELGYWAKICHYSNDSTLYNIECPTLLLFAEHDRFVPPEENIAYLHSLFRGLIPEHIQPHLFRGLDHTFHEVDDQCMSWGDIQSRPFSNHLRTFLSNWIQRHLKI